MRYDTTILIMFGFVAAHTKSDVKSESYPAVRSDINTLRFSSARRICTFLNRFRSLWPLEYMPMSYMQWVTVALFTLLEDLADAENREAFVNLSIFLRALARRWQLAKGMLRLIQITAAKMEVDLPPESKSLFKDFEAELWKTDDLDRFSSLYPNFAVSIHRDGMGSLEKVELDQFLREWDKLAL